jgi:hypothetical protein
MQKSNCKMQNLGQFELFHIRPSIIRLAIKCGGRLSARIFGEQIVDLLMQIW